MMRLNRREFTVGAVGSVVATRSAFAETARDDAFTLKYLLAAPMYGYLYIGEVLPEVTKTGSVAIDIWPKPHGNQREQLRDLGEERFAELLSQHDVPLGCITQYKLGPFGLSEEMKLAQRLGCQTIVTGARGPKGLRGSELKAAVATFVEKMRPHVDHAAECGVTIAIENHANNLMETADGLKWLAELRPSEHLAVALAPYHLPQDAQQLAGLIETLGPAIEVFYAWEHGNGCHEPQPKEKELLQMPARGPLDFQPLVAALRKINYQGWTEVFMHPYPRGLMILPSTAAITAEINRSRTYLDRCLKKPS